MNCHNCGVYTTVTIRLGDMVVCEDCAWVNWQNDDGDES